MKSDNPVKSAARRAVGERLGSFVATVTSQFTTTPDELLNRAEKESVGHRPEVRAP
jgi:hypothetical protein